MKIYVFHTGKVRVDIGVPYKQKNPLASLGLFRSKKHQVTLPVSSYLIEHPEGNVLIDTGWDNKYSKKNPNVFLTKVSKPIIKENESIDYKLNNVGVSPKNLNYVILTHLDFDHTSGLNKVTDARNIIVSNDEIKDSKKYIFRYVKSDWKNVNLKGFDFNNTGIGPVGKSYDLYGDGSILLVSTPGHSHGHLSVVVKNNDKYVIIAGDAVYTHKSWQELKLQGFTVDKKLAMKSIKWINEASRDKRVIEILANHDPEVKEHIIEI